jgi:hypothetical protein
MVYPRIGAVGAIFQVSSSAAATEAFISGRPGKHQHEVRLDMLSQPR